MNNQGSVTIAALSSSVLLLAGCGNEASNAGASGEITQTAPASAAASHNRRMGHVRWDGREVLFTNVECEEIDDHWHYSARNQEALLRGSKNQFQPEHASTATTVVRLRIYREDQRWLDFHILDNLRIDGEPLIGAVEADAEGISGTTLMIAANTAAGDIYPYPEGIEVEFQLDCP